MHNIFDVNRCVAGHYIEYGPGNLNITKGETAFSIPRNSKDISFHIDRARIVPEKNGLKCTISGWAYVRKNGAPVKSIYVAHNKKLIAKASPTNRIDVRIAMDLAFDYCGFECSYNLKDTTQAHHLISLVIVAGEVSHSHYLKLLNPTIAKRNEKYRIELDKTVVRPQNSSFDFKIEHSVLENGTVRFSGWCLLREEPDAEVHINFLKSGVLLGETTIQTIGRPDIGDHLNIHNAHHFFGFEYESYSLKDLPLAASDRSIDMILVAHSYNKKELVRIFSE